MRQKSDQEGQLCDAQVEVESHGESHSHESSSLGLSWEQEAVSLLLYGMSEHHAQV